MQHRFLSVDDKRMAGVMATLKPDHALGPFGEQIDQLPLAFVTPLRADHNDILSHAASCWSFYVPSWASDETPISIGFHEALPTAKPIGRFVGTAQRPDDGSTFLA